jgi:putative FmdB family regulatory protein
MPIFEYHCRACEADFECLVRGSRQPECPKCRSTNLEKQLSLPAVSSETTRAQAMRAARKRDKKQGTERVQEQINYEKNHD